MLWVTVVPVTVFPMWMGSWWRVASRPSARHRCNDHATLTIPRRLTSGRPTERPVWPSTAIPPASKLSREGGGQVCLASLHFLRHRHTRTSLTCTVSAGVP